MLQSAYICLAADAEQLFREKLVEKLKRLDDVSSTGSGRPLVRYDARGLGGLLGPERRQREDSSLVQRRFEL